VKARVLIVEDEDDLAQLTRMYLDREGIENRIAGSAEDAGIALAEGSFDLVILDINLPGMDGYEFLSELRKTNSVPVMIVSARETDEDVITGLSIGADEFISKPVAPRVLVARVRAMLRRARTKENPERDHKTVAFGDYLIDFDSSSDRRTKADSPFLAGVRCPRVSGGQCRQVLFASGTVRSCVGTEIRRCHDDRGIYPAPEKETGS
jgi:DNA-binding response OmpR family regulator